ncbi:unnamed protein product [Trifolium pratense]|uniref:Uncharacterized protein n=1 Tax=Trifolium pratense TaxID=57577 RepID=A0ACB0LJR1_TRIPR|nr:unnamed protein product [Trifolium pratense]
MDKISKFVNVMIIILSLFLVSTQSQILGSIPCVRDRDCPHDTISKLSKRMKCQSQRSGPIPCVRDRDCPISISQVHSRNTRMRCRKGYCVGA